MLLLKTIENNANLNKWKDKNKIEWDYLTPKQFQEQTSGKAFLFGDIGSGEKNKGDLLINDNFNKLTVCETKQKLGFFDKIHGYIKCIEENDNTIGFVRIIKLSVKKLVAILLVIIILLSLIIGFSFKKDENIKLDKAAVAYQMPDGQKNTNPNMIALPGVSEMIFQNSKNAIATPLINPDGNECYFKYKIILSKTNEVIYQSENIKPGTALVDFKLNKSLDIGSHDVIIIAEARSLKDPNEEYNAGQLKSILRVVE